jgi:hypothetical protein
MNFFQNKLIMYFKVPYYYIKELKQLLKYSDELHTTWMAEESMFSPQWGRIFFSFLHHPDLLCSPHSLRSLVYQGALTQGFTWPSPDHSSLSSAEAKKA